MRTQGLSFWVLALNLSTFSIFGGALICDAGDENPTFASSPSLNEENWISIWRALNQESRQQAPSLRVSREDQTAKSHAQWTAWTRWLPRVDLQLSQSQTQDYSFVTSGAFEGAPFSFEPQKVNLSRWALVASMPLYQRSVHLETTTTRSESKKANVKRLIQEGDFDSKLRSHFGQLLAEEYALISTLNALHASKKNLREAQVRFQLGEKTRLDVLRAEAELSNLESRKLTTLERRTTAMSQLAEWTGLPKENFSHFPLLDLNLYDQSQNSTQTEARIQDLKWREKELRQAIEELTSVEESLKQLAPFLSANPADELQNIQSIEQKLSEDHPRVSLISIEEDLALSRGSTTLASEYPQVNLQASLNKQGPNWGDTLEPGLRSYSLQLTLSMPIFSFGSTYSRYRERTALQQTGVIQAQTQALNLRNQMKNDRTRILTLIQAERAQNLSIAQNEELAALSFKSYQLGKASLLEVLSAQNSAIEARSQWVRTRVELASLVSAFHWNLVGSTSENQL